MSDNITEHPDVMNFLLYIHNIKCIPTDSLFDVERFRGRFFEKTDFTIIDNKLKENADLNAGIAYQLLVKNSLPIIFSNISAIVANYDTKTLHCIGAFVKACCDHFYSGEAPYVR